MSDLRILAIDTATEICSVALLADGAVATRSEAVGQRHTERALPLVDALLRERELALADLDFIAFGAGPGSFTGLRIACGLAQGLAWGAGKPVIGVGNLQALAARALADPAVRCVLCAIDARMQEAYIAVYLRGAGDGVPQELVPPRLAKASELAALAADVDTIAGDALGAFPEAWNRVAGQRCLARLRADAADIVRLAAAPALRAQAVPAAAAAPLYVRDRVALTTAERRAAA